MTRPAGFVAGVALAVVVTVSWGVGAGTSPTRQTAEPVAAAVVDLELVQQGLEEWAFRDAKRKERAQGLQDELYTLAQDLKVKQENANTLPKGESRRNAVMKILELQSNLKFKKELYQQLIDIEQGDLIRKMYDKIVAAASDVAEEEGFDLVLVDDRKISSPDEATQQQVTAVLMQRRVLYASSRVDITDRLIAKMNNEFAAESAGNGGS